MKLLTVVPLTCGTEFTVTLAPVETVKVAAKVERLVPLGKVTVTSVPFTIPNFKGDKIPKEIRSHAVLFGACVTLTVTVYVFVVKSSAVTT